jgi:hypothetical protein
MPKHCSSCGAALSPGAGFCHRCGSPVGGTDDPRGIAPSTAGGAARASNALPWSVAGIALLCLFAFIVGQNWRRLRAAPFPAAVATGAGGTDAPAPAPSGARAVDISSMSPDERADRLFNRVMVHADAGRPDSVRFFAPMAIQSFEALAPLNAHRRYDLGLVGVVSGDGAMARAQADTILAGEPRHLLGLILGMRAAGLQLDTLARRAYADRLSASLQSERARQLPEYIDHQPDIDAAVREVDGRTPPVTRD